MITFETLIGMSGYVRDPIKSERKHKDSLVITKWQGGGVGTEDTGPKVKQWGKWWLIISHRYSSDYYDHVYDTHYFLG